MLGADVFHTVPRVCSSSEQVFALGFEEKQTVLVSTDISHVSPTAKQPSRSIHPLFSHLGLLEHVSRPPTQNVFSLVSFSAVLFPSLPSPDGWDARQSEMSSGGRGRCSSRAVGFFLSAGIWSLWARRRVCGTRSGRWELRGQPRLVLSLLSVQYLPEKHSRKDTLKFSSRGYRCGCHDNAMSSAVW